MENIVIDGCALPLNLYNSARDKAIATGKIQCVGVIYDAPPISDAAFAWPFSVEDTVGQVLATQTKAALFGADIRAGRNVRYLMDCTRDELRGCGCAMILYISPSAEEIL